MRPHVATVKNARGRGETKQNTNTTTMVERALHEKNMNGPTKFGDLTGIFR